MKLLYFGAKWCIPCTTLKPLIESISKEEKIDVEYFDFDTDDNIFEKYEIEKLPSVLLLHNDKIINKFSGLKNKHFIQNFLKNE